MEGWQVMGTSVMVPLTPFSSTILPVKQKTSSWEESTHLRMRSSSGHALESGGATQRLCPDLQKWRVFLGFLECVLDPGENILESEDRFRNPRLVPELWAPFQNSRGFLRSLG